MNGSPYFETNNGYCHVLEDKLVINQSTNPQEIFNIPEFNPNYTIFNALPSVLVGIYFLAIFFAPLDWELTPVMVLLVIGYFTAQWLVNYTVSQAQQIPLNDLLYVEYKTQSIGAPKGYFVLHFKDEHANKKKRYLNMGAIANGIQPEVDHAKAIFISRAIFKEKK